MTGSASDKALPRAYLQCHGEEAAGEALQEPTDPLRIVIVRDMWLTGFDAPCVHTRWASRLRAARMFAETASGALPTPRWR